MGAFVSIRTIHGGSFTPRQFLASDKRAMATGQWCWTTYPAITALAMTLNRIAQGMRDTG
jgi:hypothetical protein